MSGEEEGAMVAGEEETEVAEQGEESGEEVSDTESEDDSEFDDPPEYFDDISDEELMGDLLQDRPKLETGYDTIIVVDNAPKVGPDRMSKLQSVLTKVFGRFGNIVSQDYPVDADGMFKGYFFLEFSTPEEAANAVKTGNGYKLDKSHIFKVNMFSDFEKYATIEEDWEPPQRREFTEIGNLRSWLQDENCYDQCALLYNQGEQVAIAQCAPQELKLVMERMRFTEADLHWSPLGSYLATVHKMGVALWGTEKFTRVNKFEHQGVQHIDFSPCEKYLVTFSNVVDDPDDPQHIMIWDVRTGQRKRSFPKGSSESVWPIIKWSHNGQYFARMTENLLSVYSCPSFGLLDKKSFVIKGIRDFSWSPSDNTIAYWVPGKESIPAKITIMEVLSRKETCTKSRHDVSECKLQWHKQGDYLCVKVDHWMTKTKKQMCHSFEIFHIREPDIPVDTIEIKEPVAAFALEPRGSRFGVIHGEPPTRISASFYAINDKGNKLTKIKTLERLHANNLFWSPNGQFVILAGLKDMDGHLEFYDTNDMTMMNTVDHSSATDLEWDPTGRYVVTSVSFWNQKMDTGFNLWSFQGKPLYRNPGHMEKFCQFIWRPRPPSLLTEEDLKTIRKDYKQYHHKFEDMDKSTRSKVSKELIDKRHKLMSSYKDYRKKKEQELRQKTKKLVQSLEEERSEVEYEEETIELFVNEKLEYVQV